MTRRVRDIYRSLLCVYRYVRGDHPASLPNIEIYARTPTHTCVCVCVRVNVHTFVHVCVCLRASICVCVCVCVLFCTHTYAQVN